MSTSDRRFFSFSGTLSRRRWLRLCVGAGGVLLGAGGGAWAWLRGGAPAVAGLVVLEAHEHRTLAAVVDAMFPPGSLGDIDVRSLDLPREADAFLRGEPDDNVSDMKDALTFLELGPLLDEGRLVTFSRLGRTEREQRMRAWMTSDDPLRRQVVLALRKLFNLVLYDHEEVWGFIHYPGPALGTRRLR